MIDVLPWLLFPRPRPSFQPIFCSILLPMLDSSMFRSDLVADSASVMAAMYFSLSLLGRGPSSSTPYFCRRSLARSRYENDDDEALCCWRHWLKFCLCRSETALCLHEEKREQSVSRLLHLLFLYTKTQRVKPTLRSLVRCRLNPRAR